MQTASGVVEKYFQRGMVHARDLPPTINAALGETRLKPGDIDLIVCDVGPGSYTGLRVGLTFAKTLAWSLSKPLVGIMSLDAIAFDYLTVHGFQVEIGFSVFGNQSRDELG